MARNPELARLLANLNSYSTPALSTGLQQENIDNTIYQTPVIPSGALHSTSSFSIPGLGFLAPQVKQGPQINATAQAQNQVATPSVPPPKADVHMEEVPSTAPVPDASTITTWAAAIKHVTKHIATNSKIVEKIQRMVTEQAKHEQEWWEARQAIVERQQGRPITQQKVADLLKSLGGISRPSTPADPRADEKELADYDKKVHRAMEQMVAHFDSRLAEMGIPFYAIKHELVVLENKKGKQGSTVGRIDRGELRELQKRMLQHLEDLFMD